MSVNAVAFVLSLLMFSGAHAAKLEPVEVEPLSAETVAVTQAMIRKGLRDPESVRFGEMIGGRNAQGVLHVCGWVNAKNPLWERCAVLGHRDRTSPGLAE